MHKYNNIRQSIVTINTLTMLMGMFIFIPLWANTIRVAVSANFQPVLVLAADSFYARTNNRVIATTASTGNLLSQLLNGAPYDLFFSADTQSVHILKMKGTVAPGSIRTYAYGKLVAVSRKIDRSFNLVNALHSARSVALALPAAAPYGMAAREALDHLGLWEEVSGKCVYAQSIGQCYHFARSDIVGIAFVALSTLKASKYRFTGIWQVDTNLYIPIEQRMAIVSTTHDFVTAKMFSEFIHSPPMQRLIISFGYAIVERRL